MSFNKKTGRYTQSIKRKISINIDPELEAAISCIQTELQRETSEPVTQTEAIIKAIKGLPDRIKNKCKY